MNSRDTIDTQLNVLETFDPVVPENYKIADFDVGKLNACYSAESFRSVTRASKLIVLDTMNFWMDNCMNDLMQALKHVDVLTINDEEARQLSGEYSLVKAAKNNVFWP